MYPVFFQLLQFSPYCCCCCLCLAGDSYDKDVLGAQAVGTIAEAYLSHGYCISYNFHPRNYVS